MSRITEYFPAQEAVPYLPPRWQPVRQDGQSSGPFFFSPAEAAEFILSCPHLLLKFLPGQKSQPAKAAEVTLRLAAEDLRRLIVPNLEPSTNTLRMSLLEELGEAQKGATNG